MPSGEPTGAAPPVTMTNTKAQIVDAAVEEGLATPTEADAMTKAELLTLWETQ